MSRLGPLWAALAVALVALALPAVASAHAVLLSTDPPADTRLAASPPEVTLRFNEGVQLLKPRDVSVVDRSGDRVDNQDATVDPKDARTIDVRLQTNLPDGTYTVRYLVVSADSHVVGGYFVFGVGSGALEAPFLGGEGQRGPSETSAWAVSARFLELAALGALFGLLVFRGLVWRRAWRPPPAVPGPDAARLLARERDGLWTTFGGLAVAAMIAEGYLVVVKSASALGTSVLDVVRNPADVSTVLASTDFGTLVQSRGGILFVLFAFGAWRFMAEGGPGGATTPERPAGPLWALCFMAALALTSLALISIQGHASQAPYPGLQMATDVLHLATVSVWVTGLALTGLVMWRLPAVGAGGPALAARVLACFSQVALVVVSLAIVTGVIRSAGELSDPAQLWDTAFGRSILIKLALLCPIGVLALRNRRIVTSLRTVVTPTRATIRMVRRSIAAELLLATAVVVVASVLVAQVPGRV